MNQEQDKILIFDTTLRDGEQCPGATLNVDEKLYLSNIISLKYTTPNFVPYGMVGWPKSGDK